MRPNNNAKRMRGRNRSKSNNPLGRAYESNGPEGKNRGTALQLADKYTQLARDAQSSGDRVMAENFYQHAEHYYRIVAAAYEQMGQPHARRDDERDDESDQADDHRAGSDRQHDDRRDYGSGEQPSINGFDGLDDDDDGGRRADSDDDDGRDRRGRNGARRGRQRGNGQSGGEDAGETPAYANGAGRADVSETVEPAEVANATTAPDEPDATEEVKPKRRARGTRSRTRKRPDNEADADAQPNGAAAPADASDTGAEAGGDQPG